jgi:hypothetical protein
MVKINPTHPIMTSTFFVQDDGRIATAGKGLKGLKGHAKIIKFHKKK